MIDNQFSQVSVSKLTARFRLQAYIGVAILNYGNQVFSVGKQLVIGKGVAISTKSKILMSTD